MTGSCSCPRLSTAAFFSDSEAPWFRDIFVASGSSEAEAARNQYEWLIQRCGGPPLYNQRRGHPGLLGRHGNFDVSEAGAERWLLHMRRSLEEMPTPTQTAPDAKAALMDFLTHSAHFIAQGQCLRQQQQQPKQQVSDNSQSDLPSDNGGP